MAPPALNLRGASEAFSTATTPLRNSFALSCRSPITPSPGRKRSYLEPPTPRSNYLSPSARSPLRTSEKNEYIYDDDDDACTDEESPTDQTRFLPRSPGLSESARPSIRPGDDGKLGVLSAINIIVGKTMGVGAYSVPSAIFSGVGSVGMTLLLWVVGSLISFCGLAVYLDLGTAIPRSGGERVYLERIFRRPYMLATCMFMSYVVLLGFSTPNAIVLGEHAVYVTGAAENRWNVRLIAVSSVVALCYVHARHPRFGLGLINVLGVLKIIILVVVIVSGVAGGLMGVGAERESILEGRRIDGLDLAMAGDAPSSSAQRNFRAIWENSSTQPYDYATALLKVIYCFRGYSTANQVLSDVRNPVRTLKIAAPVALTLVSVAYLAVTVAFFLVVDKDEFRSAGVVVAAVFFRKVFGDGLGAHMLPLIVVVSAAGNIAATSFAQARVNEELAREGILPAFWLSKPAAAVAQQKPGSRRPSKARVSLSSSSSSTISPSRGLLLHGLVSVAAIVLPPPGKIFNFLVDIGGYPVSVISVAVSLGLLHLHATPGWTTAYRAPRAAVFVFAGSNCLLLVLPWIPPRGGLDDARFPSYAYPATSLGVLALGAVYWVFWRRWGGVRNADGEMMMASKASAQPSSCGVVEEGAGCESEEEDDCCDVNSEDNTVVAEDESQHRKSVEHIPMVNVGGNKGVQTCGCRACPQVRRRAVCGCSNCPARVQARW